MTYGKRLKEVRKNLNMTQSDFAEALNIKNKQTISDVENGKQKKLMSDNEVVLFEKFGITPFYLATGKDMTDSQNAKNSSDKTNRTEWNVNVGDSVSEGGVIYGQTEEVVSLEYYPDTYASAGGGAYPYLQESTPMTFSKSFLNVHLGLSNFKDIFILNTTGESMEPTLKDGSLIFVNPIENEDDVVRDGAIYVMMCENTMLVKRVRVNPIDKTYTLIADHPEHDSITIAFFHESGCKFVGRVVGSFDRV